MPEERDIEKQLRAYSQHRQEQGPKGLHPATRRLLQGEVARHYGPQGRASPGRPRLLWWHPLGWATALIVGMGTVLYVTVLRPPASTELAQAEHAPIELEDVAPTPAPGPGLSRERARPELLASDPLAVAPISSASVAVETDPFDAPALVAQDRLPPAPATRPVAPEPSRALQEASEASVLRLARDEPSATPLLLGASLGQINAGVLFTNQTTDRRSPISDQPSNPGLVPLHSFRFIVTSNKVQLVDWDGSIYDGAFESHSLAAARFRRTQVPGREFSATGTHATAQQYLKIRGIAQFDPTNQAIRAYQLDSTPASDTQQEIISLPVQVDATATLEDGRVVRVRAIPVLKNPGRD